MATTVKSAASVAGLTPSRSDAPAYPRAQSASAMPASVSRAANRNAAPKIAPTKSAWKIDIALSPPARSSRSEEHTSELQSQSNLVCRLLLEKKKHTAQTHASAYMSARYTHAM